MRWAHLYLVAADGHGVGGSTALPAGGEGGCG